MSEKTKTLFVVGAIIQLLVLSAVAVILAAGMEAERSQRVADVGLLADRIQAIEEKSKRPSPFFQVWENRVRRLESRVLYPRFWQHCKTCASCRGDAQSEEGGPPPLCAEGFELMQADMKEDR